MFPPGVTAARSSAPRLPILQDGRKNPVDCRVAAAAELGAHALDGGIEFLGKERVYRLSYRLFRCRFSLFMIAAYPDEDIDTLLMIFRGSREDRLAESSRH